MAEHTAAARNPQGATTDVTGPSEAPSRGAIAHAGRDAKAAEMALKYADNPAAKRKMDVDEVEEGEAGLSPEDVEEGEMIEASQAPGLEGEEWEEVITNGKVIKMRKTD